MFQYLTRQPACYSAHRRSSRADAGASGVLQGIAIPSFFSPPGNVTRLTYGWKVRLKFP